MVSPIYDRSGRQLCCRPQSTIAGGVRPVSAAIVSDMMNFRVARGATVLALVCALAGCGQFDDWHSAQQSFQVTDTIDRIEVRGAVTNVELTTGTGPVLVQENARYRKERPTTTHQVAGTTLIVQDGGCPKIVGTAGCDVTFAIRVPAGTAVAVNANVGNVRVRDLGGDLTVQTAVGDIDATALGGKNVSAHTDTGTVRLRFSAVPDRVDVLVDVGQVDIRVPGDTRYAVECTGHADVSVDRDGSSPHRITASSQLGISISPA
jgi:hypothetical protein